MPAYSAIILAAGKGSRTHLDYNKVFYHLDSNHTVLDRSLELFESDPDCKQIIGVCASYEKDYVEKTIQNIRSFPGPWEEIPVRNRFLMDFRK